MATILNNKKLFFKDEQEESLYSYVINKFTTNKKNIQINNEFKKNTIIIAVHGGGFIFSSVLLHERYFVFRVTYTKDISCFYILYAGFCVLFKFFVT